MSLTNLFTRHPASVGESYFQHMRMAAGFAGAMFVGALACLVHAFLPFLCVKTGSSTITRLHDRMVTNRTAHVGGMDGRLESPLASQAAAPTPDVRRA